MLQISPLILSASAATEYLLQLRLSPIHGALLATTCNGFVVWNVKEDGVAVTPLDGPTDCFELPPDNAIELSLPHGIRNISTRMLLSNSIMLSAKRDFAVAGVRFV